MHVRKPFALGTSSLRSYAKPETAIAKAEELIVSVAGYDKVFATVIPTPIGDRWHPIIVLQGEDRIQACINLAQMGHFACFA